MKIGMAAAAIFAMMQASMRFEARPRKEPESWKPLSFKHRDTKKHFSREERNVKYAAQRRANRLRRKALRA